MHLIWAASILLTVAGAMSGFIALTATMADIRGVEFLPVFIVSAILYVPSGVRRLAESLASGPQGRASIIAVRSEYLKAVVEHPELRAWPETTLSCLFAASAILVKASFRAWVVVILSIGLSKLMGTTFKSDIGSLWAIFTCVEAVLIGFRSYNRGTLPLAGMSIQEMESYFRERIDRAKGGYLTPGP